MTQVTRANVDELLDGRRLQIGIMTNRGFGPRKWYDVRRNGQTRTWKRDAKRLIIPVKWGLRNTLHITERDFTPDGVMLSNWRAAGG